MKKADKLHSLLLSGLAGVLFFLGMTSCAEAHTPQEQGSLLEATSININGEEWTFRTPPPPESERYVISSHPRLFLTQDKLPEIREKLADPVYANDMNRLRSDADKGYAMANALLYLLEGDLNRGTAAKNWLLAGSFGDVSGLERAGEWVEPVLAFDWVMPLLTSAEKNAVFDLLKSNFGYDHRTATPEEGSVYWNDVWARHPQLHYPILALAIAGDGIDDGWAQEVLDLAYNESPLVLGPYGATKGYGFLDILATISLDDGGGSQAGSYGALGTDYYSMFLHSFMPMGAWETATGQPMWARSHYFKKLPFYWAYDKSKASGNTGLAILEFLTGLYRDIDPDAAALSQWLVDKLGRSKYLLVHRLILGDLRVSPKSPQELGLPTAKYIRGADMFVSSRNWDEDVLTVTAYSRYLDTNRYEPASGVFAIYRGQERLAVPSEPNKAGISEGYYSGLWIYDPNNVGGTIFQKSTYWGRNIDRAMEAYRTVSEPLYFRGGPDRIVMNDTYRGISTEYGKQLKAPGVRTARQTIVHIMDTNRDFIVVYNYTDVPPNLKRAWGMRLATAPNIQGNSYAIPGMHTTIVAPVNHTIAWVGGPGDELKSPPPEKVWYGNNRGGATAGYSSDPGKAKRWGIGNLFVQPPNAPEQLEFLVVIEVSDLNPVAVTRVSDREAQFGSWQVSFSSAGDFSVTNTGADNIPPGLNNGAPSGFLPSGTNETQISFETNENANCRYATTPGVDYAAMTGTFSTTGGTDHSTEVSGLQAGQSYNFYCKCEDSAGNTNTSDLIISFTIEQITSVSDNEKGLPSVYALEQNYPNPFNPSTLLTYSLPEDSQVNLSVYNVKGQIVRTLIDVIQAAGTKQVIWDGKDDFGNTLTSGVYFYTLLAGTFRVTQKMILLQ